MGQIQCGSSPQLQSEVSAQPPFPHWHDPVFRVMSYGPLDSLCVWKCDGEGVVAVLMLKLWKPTHSITAPDAQVLDSWGALQAGFGWWLNTTSLQVRRLVQEVENSGLILSSTWGQSNKYLSWSRKEPYLSGCRLFWGKETLLISVFKGVSWHRNRDFVSFSGKHANHQVTESCSLFLWPNLSLILLHMRIISPWGGRGGESGRLPWVPCFGGPHGAGQWPRWLHAAAPGCVSSHSLLTSHSLSCSALSSLSFSYVFDHTQKQKYKVKKYNAHQG